MCVEITFAQATPGVKPALVYAYCMYSRSKTSPPRPEAGALVIAIIVTVIATKLCLHIWCQRVAAKGGADTGPVQALADDHRNDVISNTWGLAALLAAALGPGACWMVLARC